MKFCINGCTADGEAIEANYGYLCANCYDNLRWALQKAPASLSHLREVYVLRSPISLEGSKPQKKDPPAPFNLDAWQLAELMWIALTEKYIPVDWDHKRTLDEATELCNHLLGNLESVANEKEVIYLLPLYKLTRTALYRYPLEEKPRATLLPCPECNQRTVYQPPTEFGTELEVSCKNCGFTIPPEKMEFYANLAERERDANL